MTSSRRVDGDKFDKAGGNVEVKEKSEKGM